MTIKGTQNSVVILLDVFSFHGMLCSFRVVCSRERDVWRVVVMTQAHPWPAHHEQPRRARRGKKSNWSQRYVITSETFYIAVQN